MLNRRSLVASGLLLPLIPASVPAPAQVSRLAVVFVGHEL